MYNEININLRAKVLEGALLIEKTVNEYLLMDFKILDKTKTRNFSNKAGISFKNKIDLLIDLDLIDKELFSYLELYIIFRNRFLHDIDSNSLSLIINDLDNGLRNKFYKFTINKKASTNEDELLDAFFKLFEFCYRGLISLYENRFAKINLYYESIENFKSNYILLEKETSNFRTDILKIIKTIDLKSNPELIEFVSLIRTRCSKYNEDVNHLYKKISSIENTNFEIIILENQIAARQ